MSSYTQLQEKGFRFSPDTHTYKLDGKRLTGVTTVLGVIAKPALINWAANMAVDFIEQNNEKQKWLGDLKDAVIIKPEVLALARKAHTKKRDKAADVGTLVHKAVEEWIKNGTMPKLDEKGMTMFNHFLKWAEGKKFLASEQQVYSEKYFYAGTFDFIVEIDGKKYIGDLKTSNGIYGREFFAQMAGYRIAIEEMGIHKDLHGAVIVRCGKKGDFEEKFSWDYDTDKEMFLAALKIYRINNTK